MADHLDDTMTALRNWATLASPDRRCRLIADAWNAGHTVTAIATIAGIARQTVYNDLNSRGIDPRTDRQENPTVETITIGPFTGTETDEERAEIFTQIAEKWQALPNTPENRTAYLQEYEECATQRFVARYHNTLVPFAQREAAARKEADRLLDLAETAWQELGTAGAWLAAHHRWIQAVTAAGIALDEWHAAETALHDQHATLSKHYGSALQESMLKYYWAYVPGDQRIHPGKRSEARIRALRSAVQSRREITAQTAGLALSRPPVSATSG